MMYNSDELYFLKVDKNSWKFFKKLSAGIAIASELSDMPERDYKYSKRGFYLKSIKQSLLNLQNWDHNNAKGSRPYRQKIC